MIDVCNIKILTILCKKKKEIIIFENYFFINKNLYTI